MIDMDYFKFLPNKQAIVFSVVKNKPLRNLDIARACNLTVGETFRVLEALIKKGLVNSEKGEYNKKTTTWRKTTYYKRAKDI